MTIRIPEDNLKTIGAYKMISDFSKIMVNIGWLLGAMVIIWLVNKNNSD